MKSIEERAQFIKMRAVVVTRQDLYDVVKIALEELATDLNAEKEKEVAELRAWKESALKVMPDFQKLGKLLGLPLGSDVSEQLVPAVEKLETELTATRARLVELEGIAERLYRQIGSKENDDTVPVMLAYEAYKEEKK